jgi:hypothetical protein
MAGSPAVITSDDARKMLNTRENTSVSLGKAMGAATWGLRQHQRLPVAALDATGILRR